MSGQEKTRRRGAPPLPVGPGVAARYLRIAEADLVKLGHVLSGYDGLASLHGDGADVVAITTESQAAALDALLDELRAEGALRFEVLREPPRER